MKKARMNARIENVDGDSARCIMTICPGCTDQRGDRLRATISAIKDNFDFCRIIFADTLDVYNMQRHHDDFEKAMDSAKERGREWLDLYYKDLVRYLGRKYFSITLWDEVKSDPLFTDHRSALDKLYENATPVRTEFDGRIERHTDITLKRMQDKGLDPDRQKLLALSRSYLLEEYAGLTVVRSWTSDPEIYPGDCIADPNFFNRHAVAETAILDLSIPAVCGVTFTEESSRAPLTRTETSPFPYQRAS